MSYNINYTSLPAFSSNSIGYLLANQDYTTNFTGNLNPVFRVTATPGIYLFTSLVASYSIPGILNSILRNASSNIIICANYTEEAIRVSTLSHVFSITETSTLAFTIESGIPGYPNQLSYSLVRIA